MKITNLKDSLELVDATLELIETSFKYKKPHSFAVDFAPLMDLSNHHNCFITVDEEDQVLAHIGVREVEIAGFKVAMLGGIAVDEKSRGKGLFQELMAEVITEKKDDVAFFLLWSDLEKMYQKFGFYLCGTQLEVAQRKLATNFTRTTYHALSQLDKIQIQNLYSSSFQKLYVTVDRTKASWETIKMVKSADIYIKRERSEISDYFFMNKGQDLTGIIYEYGSKGDLRKLLIETLGYGKLWLGSPSIEEQERHYQFSMAPGDNELFAKFIHKYTNSKINIRDINSLKQEVYFYFYDDLLSLSIEDFLRGVFGPGQFEEFGELKPFFISGLDSI